MMPIEMLVPKRRAGNLLGQVRWRNGVYCPRCRAESVIQYGSYRVFQRYRCKNCDRTFNDQSGTVFEYSSVALRKWFLALYTYIRPNTSIRQLDVETDVAYRPTGELSDAARSWLLIFLGAPTLLGYMYIRACLEGVSMQKFWGIR